MVLCKIVDFYSDLFNMRKSIFCAIMFGWIVDNAAPLEHFILG